MSAIAMATMGKFEYVVDVGGGSGLPGDGDKKKPQVTVDAKVSTQEIESKKYIDPCEKPEVTVKKVITQVIKSKSKEFKINKIEEEKIGSH